MHFAILNDSRGSVLRRALSSLPDLPSLLKEHNHLTMATQKGIHLVKVGETLEIVDSIPRSVPGAREILVQSLYVALNPV
jgi:hypothetical protein